MIVIEMHTLYLYYVYIEWLIIDTNTEIVKTEVKYIV